MSENLFFEPDAFHSTLPNSPSATSPPTKPTDDFSTALLLPHAIFYLAAVAPHTDTHTLFGPVTSFSHLLVHIETIVSDSPRAIDKLDALRPHEDASGTAHPNPAFAERGFTTFVVEGQRGTFTVLQVLRQTSKAVRDALPSPVYTVTRHGPLAVRTGEGVASGYAATTRLVGSWIDRDGAKRAAEQAMRDMLVGERGVSVTQSWEKGVGGGMLMAMKAGSRWEVKIAYEDQVLKRAREQLERDGECVGWRF